MLMHATITQNYLHVIARILGDPHAGERERSKHCTHTKRPNTLAGRFQLST